MSEEIISFKEPTMLEKLQAAMRETERNAKPGEGLVIRFLPDYGLSMSEPQSVLKHKVKISDYQRTIPRTIQQMITEEIIKTVEPMPRNPKAHINFTPDGDRIPDGVKFDSAGYPMRTIDGDYIFENRRLSY